MHNLRELRITHRIAGRCRRHRDAGRHRQRRCPPLDEAPRPGAAPNFGGARERELGRLCRGVQLRGLPRRDRSHLRTHGHGAILRTRPQWCGGPRRFHDPQPPSPRRVRLATTRWWSAVAGSTSDATRSASTDKKPTWSKLEAALRHRFRQSRADVPAPQGRRQTAADAGELVCRARRVLGDESGLRPSRASRFPPSHRRRLHVVP